MKTRNTLLGAATALLLTGCSASLEDYQGTTPEFSLAGYFDGRVTAWGIVQDYGKSLTRRFCVDIVGTWDDNIGQLHETFYFNDGEEQIRIWQLSIDDNGQVTGTAGDVVGVASGAAEGTAFNWRYTLKVPVGESEYEFAIDDWMYQMDSNRLFNRSYMKKAGITVAEISLFFDKTAPVRTCKG